MPVPKKKKSKTAEEIKKLQAALRTRPAMRTGAQKTIVYEYRRKTAEVQKKADVAAAQRKEAAKKKAASRKATAGMTPKQKHKYAVKQTEAMFKKKAAAAKPKKKSVVTKARVARAKKVAKTAATVAALVNPVTGPIVAGYKVGKYVTKKKKEHRKKLEKFGTAIGAKKKKKK